MADEYDQLLNQFVPPLNELRNAMARASRSYRGRERDEALVRTAATFAVRIDTFRARGIAFSNTGLLQEDASRLGDRLAEAMRVLRQTEQRPTQRLQRLAEYQVFVKGHPLFEEIDRKFQHIWPYLLDSQRTRLLALHRVAGFDHAYDIVFDVTDAQREYLQETMRAANVYQDYETLGQNWYNLISSPWTVRPPTLTRERPTLHVPAAQRRRIAAALYVPNEMGDFLGIPETRPPSPESQL